MQAGHHHLRLMPQARSSASALEEVSAWLNSASATGSLWLHSADRVLNLPELRAIQERLHGAGMLLTRVQAETALGLVAAAALGLETSLEQPDAISELERTGPPGLTIHRGTLRSGDHLEVEGSLLVLGDVNPGAPAGGGSRRQ